MIFHSPFLFPTGLSSFSKEKCSIGVFKSWTMFPTFKIEVLFLCSNFTHFGALVVFMKELNWHFYYLYFNGGCLLQTIRQSDRFSPLRLLVPLSCNLSLHHYKLWGVQLNYTVFWTMQPPSLWVIREQVVKFSTPCQGFLLLDLLGTCNSSLPIWGTGNNSVNPRNYPYPCSPGLAKPGKPSQDDRKLAGTTFVEETYVSWPFWLV